MHGREEIGGKITHAVSAVETQRLAAAHAQVVPVLCESIESHNVFQFRGWGLQLDHVDQLIHNAVVVQAGLLAVGANFHVVRARKNSIAAAKLRPDGHQRRHAKVRKGSGGDFGRTSIEIQATAAAAHADAAHFEIRYVVSHTTSSKHIPLCCSCCDIATSECGVVVRAAACAVISAGRR